MIIDYITSPVQSILHELFSVHYNFMKQVLDCISLFHFTYKKTDAIRISSLVMTVCVANK